MNYLNQYKITSLNAMHQNHFLNQTNQNNTSRFHHPTPTIVFPQTVNDVRCQSSSIFDPRHLDLQNALKLERV